MTRSDQRQVEELTRRLAEAEATIAALVAGQVDAIIDGKNGTPLLLAKAQDALRASEEQYRYIVETTNDGIWVIDAQHQTRFMNRRMAQMLACEADMGLGRSPFDFVDEAGRAALTAQIEGRSTSRAEIRYVRADGTSVWTLVDGTPMRDDQGRYRGSLAVVKDVTEGRRAAAALAELSRRTARRERILSTTLSAISDFAYIYDHDGRFLFANQPLLDLWGIRLEEAVGKNSYDLGYPDALAADLQRQVLEVFATAERRTGETAYTSPAGVDGYYEYILTPVLGTDGEVEFVAGCTRDITAHKRTERDLTARTHELEMQAVLLNEQAALQELVPDPIIVRDMAGEILFWNHGAERLYGWLSHEAIGRNTRELIRTEFALPVEEVDAALLRDGHWQGEVIHHTRDGKRLTVASHWTLERDSAGTPIRVLGVNHDVTRRKQAEIDRLLLTERLSLATAVAEVGVWDWDLASNTLTWDATMFGIYGFTPIVPMRYRQWAAAVDPDDLGRVEATLRRAVEEKGQTAAEFRIVRTGGLPRQVSAVQRAVLDERGHVKRVVGVNVDVTERREAEADLRTARDAAEAANRAKSEFLANMSHEIRTPMNGVIGMTDLVLDSDLTAEQRDNLEVVKSSAEGLLGIINDILDFSRIEAGKLALDPFPFSIRDASGDTASAVALRAQQKGLELVVDVDENVPEMLTGDPGRLRQILVNLLGNAIKFTERGEVVLKVTREMDVGTSSDVVLHFSVRDTGVGIPLDRQQRIFQSFTQADGSTTRAYGGTGLGLTISSQLVQLMGGRIWMDSQAGRGSTVHFTARFARIDGAVPVTTVPDVRELRDVAVLVVDDNATNRRVLEEMLVGWRMVPTLVASASEALTELRRAQHAGRSIPLVLTDIVMPDGDGFMLASDIKGDPKMASVAIVVLTSAGQPGDVARCRKLGIAGYLQKPVKRADLRGAMLMALGTPAVVHPPSVVTRHTLRGAQLSGRVLVVDDNAIDRLVAKRLLEKRGHSVVAAADGRSALTVLAAGASGEFGCLLLDLQMSDQDGVACVSIIRERERESGGHLPIIAMTALGMKVDEARCLAAGMDACLSKPIQAQALYAMVDRHLVPTSTAGSPSAFGPNTK